MDIEKLTVRAEELRIGDVIWYPNTPAYSSYTIVVKALNVTPSSVILAGPAYRGGAKFGEKRRIFKRSDAVEIRRSQA